MFSVVSDGLTVWAQKQSPPPWTPKKAALPQALAQASSVVVLETAGRVEDGVGVSRVAAVHVVGVLGADDGHRVGGHDGVDGGRGRITGRSQGLGPAGQGGRGRRGAVVAIQGAAVDDAVAGNLGHVAARQLRVDVDGVVVAVATAGLGGVGRITRSVEAGGGQRGRGSGDAYVWGEGGGERTRLCSWPGRSPSRAPLCRRRGTS